MYNKYELIIVFFETVDYLIINFNTNIAIHIYIN